MRMRIMMRKMKKATTTAATNPNKKSDHHSYHNSQTMSKLVVSHPGVPTYQAVYPISNTVYVSLNQIYGQVQYVSQMVVDLKIFTSVTVLNIKLITTPQHNHSRSAQNLIQRQNLVKFLIRRWRRKLH